MTNKYIMSVNCSNDLNEINMAVVDINEEMLKLLSARQRVFNLALQEDGTLYSMRYWCSEVKFCNLPFGEDDEEYYLPENGGCIEVEDDLEYTGERIECLTMVVTKDGVHWTCYQKHGDDELRTDQLAYVSLKGLPTPAVLKT